MPYTPEALAIIAKREEEIASLREQLSNMTAVVAQLEQERDEYNAARLALISERDDMWDELHKAKAWAKEMTEGRDNALKSYLDCRGQLAAMTKDVERYRMLRRGQHWSVINGIGDILRGDELDAAIDEVMK